jgi:uncharacterized protein (TIRG00374 family)
MILTAPTARPIASLVTRVGRLLPRGWADLAKQLTLFALLDLAYELSRVIAAGDRGVALRHAHDIVSTERSLGLFHELSVQHFAASYGIVQSIANWTYFNCQFTISFGFLFWVYLRRNEAFPLVRNVFVAANTIGLVVYSLYPAAPPRMLSGLGFVDSLNETSVNHNSGLIASLSNPYAAMPSLHTAYALIVGVSAVLLVRRRWLRVAWAFYPALVVFSIVATANHFFLDAAGGAGVAAVATVAILAAHRRSRRIAAALVALPVASFLIYRFAGQAGDTIDTLGAVAAGALLLALAANLVSVWLKAAVWRRTLAAVPNAPALSTRDLLPSVFIGFLFNTVLVARLGEVAKVAVLRRRLQSSGHDVGVAAIAGSLVAEQIALGVSLVLVGVALAATIVHLPGWAITSLIYLGVLTGGAVIAGILVRRSRLSLPSVSERLARPARDLIGGGLRVLHDPRELAIAVMLGTGSWIAQIAGIYWTLDAFGLPHTAAVAGSVFLVSTLVGVFPIMPGNVGVFQLAVAGVLASSFGVSAASGAAFAIGLQATEVALGAGLGALFLLAEGLSFADLRNRAPAAPVKLRPVASEERALAFAA